LGTLLLGMPIIGRESARLECQQMQQGIVTLKVFVRAAGDAALESTGAVMAERVRLEP
jgi:hypothetical protein